MTESQPVACSLDSSGLEQRVATIAQIGAESFISRDLDGNRHLLHFHAHANTQRRLEEIVAAEAKCCSFLDLSLTAEDGELILTIAAPENGQAVADALAGAFAR
jgi:hypothetical protein